MTATTFIHTSDFQLGMTRWFLKGEAQGRFNDDREAAIMRLGELAEDTGADFIVVAGDVFEHNSLSREILARATEMFKRLPVPVYVLPGNHDPLVADSVFYKTSADNVHVIADSQPIEVAPGVELVGAPYLSKRANQTQRIPGSQPCVRCVGCLVQVLTDTAPDAAEARLQRVDDGLRPGFHGPLRQSRIAEQNPLEPPAGRLCGGTGCTGLRIQKCLVHRVLLMKTTRLSLTLLYLQNLKIFPALM